MSEQLTLFESLPPEPEGLHYAADFVPPETEQKLIFGIQDLPLPPFQFGQFEGKRRVASFGFRYDYALRQLQRSEPIPTWLAEIVAKVETFGGPATPIRQVLCTEYDAGVGIGFATSPTSTEYSAFRWDPPANSGFAGPPARLGIVLRSMPNPVRFT